MLGVVVLAGCTGSSSHAPTAPTVAAARSVLAGHAAAVLAHDRAHFLAALDPSAPARAYRAAQAAELTNLAGVPLSHWSYGVVGPVQDATAVHAAAARYEAPALLLHVTLRYALAGVDAVPTGHAQYLTFVAREGHTYLAGDDALAARGSVSWVGPWHYGPLTAARGRAALVLGPPAAAPLLRRLAAETDAAVAAVSQVWTAAWSRRVAVLVPASVAEFRALTGSAPADVSAVALTDGIDPGSGRAYGQRLVLDPAHLDALTPTGRGIVLRHEVTHLATAADTADIAPRWLAEGFAEYVGNRTSGQSVPVAAGELRDAVRHGAVPTALPDDGAFAGAGAALARTYEQSWLACRLIAQQAGVAGLVRFYRAVGTALAPRAEALADAFRSVLHESEGVFTGRWRSYLKTELS